MSRYDPMFDPPEPPEYPRCPVCGSERYEEIFVNDDGICGCSDCIVRYDADEYWQEKWEEQDINRRYDLEDILYEEQKDRRLFDEF